MLSKELMEKLTKVVLQIKLPADLPSVEEPPLRVDERAILAEMKAEAALAERLAMQGIAVSPHVLEHHAA